MVWACRNGFENAQILPPCLEDNYVKVNQPTLGIVPAAFRALCPETGHHGQSGRHVRQHAELVFVAGLERVQIPNHSTVVRSVMVLRMIKVIVILEFRVLFQVIGPLGQSSESATPAAALDTNFEPDRAQIPLLSSEGLTA